MRGVAYQEYPHLFGGLFDVPAQPCAADVTALVDELVSANEAEQVAYRDGQRYVARLCARGDLSQPAAEVGFAPGASYLVTGGLGGLGMQVARWMVQRGARHLILTGRSALPPRTEWLGLDPASPVGKRAAFIRELESLGASVRVASFDVADERALTVFLEQHRRQALPPIRGVMHAAGLSEPRLLTALTQQDYATTVRPKVMGALLLDRHLEEPLDWFVMFSSVAAFAFTAGQGDYAAANAVLDAVAHDRRRRGLPATSVNFGPWAEAGMATLLGGYFEQRGMTPFAPALGLQALEQLIERDLTQATVLWISDAQAFAERNFSSSAKLSFIEEVARAAADSAQSRESSADMLGELRELADPAEQYERVLLALRELLARVLRLKLEQVDVQASLSQLGLDSLLAVELKNRLFSELSVSFSVVELLRETRIDELGRTLQQRLCSASGQQQLAPRRSESGELPLAPNQRWFFARKLPNPNHWNMAATWEVARRLDPDRLRQAVECVLEFHPTLRARFEHTESGWRQSIAARGSRDACHLLSLAGASPKEREQLMDEHAARRQAAFDLSQGPLLDVSYFDFGEREGGRLLTVLHHLVSDVFSQQIVVADIELAYRQLESGAAAQLPTASAGFSDWVAALERYARSAESAGERRYWLEQRWSARPLPVDFDDARQHNHIGSVRLLTASLGAAETRALLAAAGQRADTHTLDLLMTAFALSLRQWCGLDSVGLDVIVHGREVPGSDLDLGRSVGLFAHGIPLLLSLPESDSLEQALLMVQHQLRPFQEQGRNFAALRWLSGDGELESALARLPKRNLIFNYIGQFESSHDEAALFRVVPSVPRGLEPSDNPRDFLLQFQVGILNGELTLLLNYSENVHRRASVERLAEAFLRVLRGFAGAPRNERNLRAS
ncbi:MAG: KR domain-containing protein [Polyangiaceae bacterium]